MSFAGGFPLGLLGGSSIKPSTVVSEEADVAAPATPGFVGGFFETSLEVGGGFDGPLLPALHLTVAFSYASLTFAFRTSANPSISALSGRSPTIFMRVPKHMAASLRAPSKLSSRSVERGSVSNLICPGCTGVEDVERHRPRNFKVPSFTCGFLFPNAGSKSGIMSGRIV